MSQNEGLDVIGGPNPRSVVKNEQLNRPDNETDERVNEIRREIEQTRANMTDTIDAIQERLSPTHIKEQLKQRVRREYEDAKQTVRGATVRKVENMVKRASDIVDQSRRNVVDVIKANPIPATMIGVGVCWMLWSARGQNGRTSQRLGADDRMGLGNTGGSLDQRITDTANSFATRAKDAVTGAVGQVQTKAGEIAGTAKETLNDATARARETATQLADQAQQQAQRLKQGIETSLQERPLAIGAVALALGVAVGLALPQTRKENELLGETRNSLLDQAQATVDQAIDQVGKSTDQMNENRPLSTGRAATQQSGSAD